MYTFTKLHDNVHKYGSKMKLNAKNEESTKVINSTVWHFCDLLQN